jgi:predicted TIM-barrel fold metal-dependent hydrolase
MSLEQLDSFEFLSQEEKRDILYNNAAKFLGLSEEQIAAHHQH